MWVRPIVAACWHSPWRWPFPSCQLPWHWSIVCTQLLLGHGDSLPHQGPQPSSGNPAQMWNPRLGSWHLAARHGKLPSAFFSHFQALFLVCHETTLNFSEHELFHLTWLEREWASLGILLTIICFSLDQTFSHASIFGPALPGGVGRKAGPVASRARSGPQIWDLCQIEGKRLQTVTENAEGLKTRWVRGFVQHRMPRWWQIRDTALTFTALPLGC